MTDRDKFHIVHTESSGGWGGQELRILAEAREMQRRGYQMTLVCSDDSPIAHRASHYGLRWVELPIGKKTLRGLIAICRWLRHNEFDLVNTHSSSDSWMVAVGMRIVNRRKPLLRTRHISAPVSKFYTARWLYRSASDHIVTTGEMIREALMEKHRIDADKITSVPTGIDINELVPGGDKTSIRESLDLPLDKKIIGILATLRSWKGHQYLLEAFAEIKHPDIHLLIVGDGPQWENIGKAIDELKIGGQVTMAGNRHEIKPWLQSMDIFALPSYANEGVPQSLMQAMACGLPVISTPVGCIQEIVSEDTGILVQPQNASALRAAIESLLADPGLGRRLGTNARKYAEHHCGVDRMGDRMEAIFRKLVSTSGP